VKDQRKWEACCNQSAEAFSKQLRINESAAFSKSDAPGTPTTHASADTPTDVGGLIRPIRSKATKRNAKEKAPDLVLEVVTRELSTLGTTNLRNSTMFERYVLPQEKKADAAEKAVELRDRHQRLKEMKYEDKILKMILGANTAKPHPFLILTFL